jgi:hypothetical protein
MTIDGIIEINSEISTDDKLDLYFQRLTQYSKQLFLIILLIVMILNPISFAILAVIHWKCDFKSNLPQLMIAWALIHLVVYIKLIYLKFKKNFNADYLNSKVQILLNLCLIVWFVVFTLLIVILSNGKPDDFSALVMCYIVFNMILSFMLLGIPCILVISTAICDAR